MITKFKIILVSIIILILIGIGFFIGKKIYDKKEKPGTTVIIPGDSTYHKPVTSNPKPVAEIKPAIPVSHPAPAIIYRKDTSGRKIVDTNAIKARQQLIIDSLQNLLSEYETTRYYKDSINDTTAKVKAVIQDKVKENRLQAGRKVSFMNYRPVAMKTVVLEKKKPFFRGLNAYIGTDVIDYPHLIPVASGELEFGIWRILTRIEPEVTIKKKPKLGITTKIGFQIFGK